MHLRTIYAEVDTPLADSLEFEGLPGSPWKLNLRNKHVEPWQKSLSLFLHSLLYVKQEVLSVIQNVYIIRVSTGRRLASES